MLVLYTCWELTSITSFLLIGNRHTEPRARAAALHALLVTGGGGLALLGGLVVLAHEAGTYRLSEILADPPHGDRGDRQRWCCVIVGALTKSAQYPFHAWLPGAMAAPTPVSAYLHSATMVTAGVFLVGRFSPSFADVGLWRPLVLTAGCCTLVFGGLRALRQHDLKLLLAFGTVSQLGLMMILFGAGHAATVTAGWALLVAHAAFKGALFMVVGIIDHQTGTRDIRTHPSAARRVARRRRRRPARGCCRWRACRSAPGSSRRSSPTTRLADGGFARRPARARRRRRRVDAHRRVLGTVLLGSVRRPAPPARRRRSRRRPRRRRGSLVAPPAALALAGVVLGVAPRTCSIASRPPRSPGSAPKRRRSTCRSGTDSVCPSPCPS